MRIWTMLLALSLTAAAQDGTRPDGLTLVSRHVDLEAVENLVLLQVQIKVANPTDRPLEGDLSFTAPRGAAVYGLSILKHIGSTERKAHLLPPDTAAGLYNADLTRQREGTDELAMRGGIGVSGTRPTTPSPAPPAAPTTGGIRGFPASGSAPQFGTPTPTGSAPQGSPLAGNPLTGANPRSGTGTNSMANRTTLVTSGTNVRSNDPRWLDPALLERVSEDRYRLRFYPVPPRDNQTVTILLAFEAAKEGHGYAAVVPLRLDSAIATTPDSRSSARISVSSADSLKTVASSSHAWRSIERDEDGRRVRALIDSLGGDADLALTYGLGFWAKPQEFGENSRTTLALTSPQAAAFRAIVASRGLSAGVVSANGSFLVIPKNDARALVREAARELKPENPAPGPASEEDLKECEFVRAAMKLPARTWAPRCEIHVVSTTDAARLQWARDNGITSGRSNGLLQGTSFEYVKHGVGCRVQEPNVEKLRQQAGAVK